MLSSISQANYCKTINLQQQPPSFTRYNAIILAFTDTQTSYYLFIKIFIETSRKHTFILCAGLTKYLYATTFKKWYEFCSSRNIISTNWENYCHKGLNYNFICLAWGAMKNILSHPQYQYTSHRCIREQFI